MANKKSLYDILGVAPDAPFSEIEAAYNRASRRLDAPAAGLTEDAKALESKVLKMAFQTLSNVKSRQAYDAKLNPGASFTLLSPLGPPETLSLQAAAVSLKADAASLIAEAAVLKADAVSLNIETTPQKLAGLVAKGVRALFTALGAIFAIGVTLLFSLYWVSSASREKAKEDASASERVMIQEYYQQTGVRAKSRTELELLQAQSRRDAKAQYDTDRQKREAERKEREYERFVEDSRRQAEQVSENLRREKERAEQEERLASEKVRMELRMKEEAERRRIENERRKLGLH
jgi:hypothetical protein